jgi:hypothetical protein
MFKSKAKNKGDRALLLLLWAPLIGLSSFFPLIGFQKDIPSLMIGGGMLVGIQIGLVISDLIKK